MSGSKRTLIAPMLLLGTALLGAGCGLFKPASPQLPSGSALIGRYTDPDTTLATMALAIADKATTNGQSVYMHGYADSTVDGVDYHAFFDPATVARFTSGGHAPPDLNWGVRYEQNFYVKFAQLLPGASYEFVWQADPSAPEDDRQPTTALLHRKYLALGVLAGSDSAVVLSRGYTDLAFAKLNGDWKIVRWQDREDPAANINAGELSFGQRRLESQ
ncbi:MAG TPA: hypothetical protein VMJ70_03855 [Candidatus Sulfotelmatobacter sp.]|nr:hypothetical protein [Candidatus Sulfotelmatobacter sp.]